MKLIDAQFMETPRGHGGRQTARRLRRQGYAVGRKRIRRLMGRMGLAAVYPQPRTTVPPPERRKRPYLLRNMVIDRPNQVWCADIAYLPMRRGLLYLVAIMDWASRRVLAWRLSNTMDADFCIEALEGEEDRRMIRWIIRPTNNGAPRPAQDLQHRPGDCQDIGVWAGC